MTKIKELSQHLANQIAAGEVIERPASVVKELVENAIDAHSTQIDIQLEEAGLRTIRVIDNGDGIPEEEVPLAFKRHATSKIYQPEDLFRIHSLGFRGEALPSIASIAKVTIETAVEKKPGRFLQISGGNVTEDRPHIARKGTTITVADIFYNTPARLKYLKSLQTELANSSDIVNRLALSHPQIAFHLTHDGNTLLRTPGNGDLRQALAGVYGTQTARKMKKIENENLDFKIGGYISLPEMTRASRNYITLILNGRYIKNYTLQKALIDGYGSKLMVGRFPVAVLVIETDALLLDVNVHPSKREVRISKEAELVQLVISAVQQALKEEQLIPHALENLSFRRKSREQFRQQEQLQVDLPLSAEVRQTEELREGEPGELYSAPAELPESGPAISAEEPPRLDPDLFRQAPPGFSDHLDVDTLASREETAIPMEHKEALRTTVQKMEKEAVGAAKAAFPELYYFGQMHGTYLFAQNEKGMYIIDQHAAQERIKYEYYREEIGNVTDDLQGLLVPLTFSFPANECLVIDQYKETLEKLGIFLEPFGHNTYLMDRHPVWITPGQEEAVILEIIEFVLQETDISVKKLREAAAIMMSCKRSIKANHHLSDGEARQLLADLSRTANPYNCPHGRPVLIHFSNTDMEKMFKRIQDPH